MTKPTLLMVFAFLLALGATRADERKDLTRLAVPDTDEAALKAVKEWLDSRGIVCEVYNKTQIVMKRGGVLFNMHPYINKGELDRLRFVSTYTPKDEFKKTKQFEEHAAKLNKQQNFLQVWVFDDGRLGIGANLTFFDELSAHHFDGFVDSYTQIVKRWVLTDETLKMVK